VAVKTCRVCSKSKPVTEYETGRGTCRPCRRAQERERAARRDAEQAPSAEPARPAAIPVAELTLRARVDNRAAPADLGDWLMTDHLAELTPDGLVATSRGLELAAAIGWG
jgi:hypothetical protein